MSHPALSAKAYPSKHMDAQRGALLGLQPESGHGSIDVSALVLIVEAMVGETLRICQARMLCC